MVLCAKFIITDHQAAPQLRQRWLSFLIRTDQNTENKALSRSLMLNKQLQAREPNTARPKGVNSISTSTHDNQVLEVKHHCSTQVRSQKRMDRQVTPTGKSRQKGDGNSKHHQTGVGFVRSLRQHNTPPRQKVTMYKTHRLVPQTRDFQGYSFNHITTAPPYDAILASTTRLVTYTLLQ